MLKKIIYGTINSYRTAYYKRMKKRLTNLDFSVIASDCFGTFVYHNLGLRFTSPTINLFFSPEDFIAFVSDLKGFLSAEFTEVTNHDKPYPVATLTSNGKTITVEFMHYHSFEEAKTKWHERKQRINFSNLYIIQTIAKTPTKKQIEDFEALPYKNKLLVTKESDFKGDYIATHKVFNKPDYKHGEILTYKSRFSYKKYMDDIDYVEFLNRK